tara:strand:+ start:1698 stop:2294 length:597 start_codon:yes stop_codon:yes gene_type:complete
MSFRYRERTVVDGEAIDPHDFNENLNALVGELNGKLDRDNIPEKVIDKSFLPDNTFTTLLQSTLTNARSFNDQQFNTIHLRTEDFEDDGVLTVFMGGTYSLQGNDMPEPSTGTGSDILFKIRCVLNGQVISNVRDISANYQASGFYAVGTGVVVAGTNDISIQMKCTAPSAIGTLNKNSTDFTYKVSVSSLTMIYRRR